MTKITLGFLSLALVMAFPAASQAETVVEKVARTGVLTVGTSFDIVPYSYIDAEGELVGYSVDVVDLIEAQLEAELGRDIVVQRHEVVDTASRIPLLTSGDIDLSCDTQFSWDRDRYVDFSLSYSLSGIRLLTLEDSTLGAPESLVNQRIGVLENSLAAQVIGLVQPKAVLVPVATPDAAFTALNAAEVDAIAGDTVILAGLVAQQGSDDIYALTPVVPYERYGIACMVPENNSTFLNIVDYAIAGLLQGYVSGDSEATAMVNSWLGPDGIVPLPEDLITSFFEAVLVQRAQVPPAAATP